MNICTNFGSAATGLCHLAAVAMHGPAASPLFVRHGYVCDTGEDRRCRYEQQQYRDEAEQTAHHLTICFRLAAYGLFAQTLRLNQVLHSSLDIVSHGSYFTCR